MMKTMLPMWLRRRAQKGRRLRQSPCRESPSANKCPSLLLRDCPQRVRLSFSIVLLVTDLYPLLLGGSQK